MMFPRLLHRLGLHALVWVVAAAAAPAWAQAPPYPQPGKPIRLLVGLAAGGSLDAQARVVAQKITEQTGAQVLIDNKPGASMMLAASEVARANPDGYTLLYAPSSTFAQNPHTLNNVPYDPFKDFTPITLATRGPLVLTLHVSVPATGVKELVAWARANPGKLNFASFGTGTSSHVYAEAFGKAAGIDIVHVPYKGTADAARDLLEGRVQAYFDAAPTAIINAATGKIRILGVAAPQRSPYLPNVPTISEQGVPGIDLTSWIAVVGPARMPPELVARVNAVFVAALSTPQVHDAIAKGAYETAPSTPAELATEVAGPSRNMDWVRNGSRNLTRADILQACDDSLRRLKTDRIDLYQIHWPNRNVPMFGAIYFDPAQDEAFSSVHEQLEAMAALVQAGKVRHIGLSNETPWGLCEFVHVAEQAGLPRVASVQNPYALVNRVVDNGLDEALHRTGVALLAYSPLGFGTLSGKYDAPGFDATQPALGRIARFETMRKQRWGRPETLAAARRYNALARAHGLTPTRMALAYCYGNWRVASTIIGVTTIEQLDENVAAWGTVLPPALLAAIDAVRWEIRDPAQ